MIAKLVPPQTIPALAEQIDSLAMLRTLQYLQKAGYILTEKDLSPASTAILGRLADLGLIDSGYDGEIRDRPDMWIGNGNGSRVLRQIEESPTLQRKLESKLEIGPRAETALSALVEWDQAKVLAVAEAIQGKEPASWGAEAVCIDEGKQEYLLRVSSELRAFIRVVGTRKIELFDIVREETLRMFRDRQIPAGVPR